MLPTPDYAGFRGTDGHGGDWSYSGVGCRCWCGVVFGSLREIAAHIPHVEVTAGMLRHGAILGTDRVCKCGRSFYSYRELRAHGEREIELERQREAVAA